MKIALYMTLGAALAAPVGAVAAAIDGKAPIICATLEAVQCSRAPGSSHACARGVAGSFDLPQFLRLDFDKKSVTTARDSGVKKTSAIGSTSRANGHVIVQGVDSGGGFGWSLVVEENTGRMTASAIGDEEGALIFGACTPL